MDLFSFPRFIDNGALDRDNSTLNKRGAATRSQRAMLL